MNSGRYCAFVAAYIAAVLAGCNTTGPQHSAETARASSVSDTPVPSPAFWKYWGDGQAELAGYDLTIPRYGQLRRGIAVTVFVSEAFSDSLRVKADPGRHPAADLLPVMKLNLIKDFQTGIYDYNLMTSSFLALDAREGRPAGSPVKVSFSSQEWCGHVYHQLLFDPMKIRETIHSYFDGEADRQDEIANPAGGVSEDALMFWGRGMAHPYLAPGESRTVAFLPSLQSARLLHRSLSWQKVVLSRSTAPLPVNVPAGAFNAEVWSARGISDGIIRTFYVEKAEPHRILKWESSDGEKAELLASDRMKYWDMHEEGGEAALQRLGLTRRPPRTP